jgi:hypothetical protein
MAAILGLAQAKGDALDAVLNRLYWESGRRYRRSWSMWKSISPRVPQWQLICVSANASSQSASVSWMQKALAATACAKQRHSLDL